MPTTLTKPGPGLAPVVPAPASPRHEHGHRWLLLASGLLAVLVGLTAWTLVDRLAGPTESSPVPTVESVWVEPFFVARVSNLQQDLRDNGYAIPVTGVLDPVARSAATDFIRFDEGRALEPWLAAAMRGTVITGRRDPVAWNARFGADRATRLVERPLTGPGGQLDAYGNLSG